MEVNNNKITIKKHSLKHDLDCFPTSEAKLHFLQCYVAKYKEEFDLAPFELDNLTVHLTDQIDYACSKQAQTIETDDDLIHVPLPNILTWISIPIYPK